MRKESDLPWNSYAVRTLYPPPKRKGLYGASGNLALQHMREMQISPQDRAVIARVFCTRMANELRVECAA